MFQAKLVVIFVSFLLFTLSEGIRSNKRGVPVGQVYPLNNETTSSPPSSSENSIIIFPKAGAAGAIRYLGTQKRRAFTSTFPSSSCNCFFYITGGSPALPQSYPYYQISYPNATADLDVFSLKQGEFVFQEWPSMAMKRAYHIAVDHEGGVWVWGGGSNLMERYDFLGNFWEYVPANNTIQDRYASSYTKVNCSLFVFGGLLDSGQVTNELWAFDFVELQWTMIHQGAVLPSPRAGATLKYYEEENSLVLFGGTDNVGSSYNDLWLFSLTSNSWTLLSSSSPPPSRWGHLSFLIDQSLFITLGESNDYGNIWEWSFVNNSWSVTVIQPNQVSPTPKTGFSSAFIEGSVILFSGITLDTLTTVNVLADIWYLNTNTLSWWRYECYPGFVFDFPICELAVQLSVSCEECNCGNGTPIQQEYIGSIIDNLKNDTLSFPTPTQC
jgi:hypothetical protein